MSLRVFPRGRISALSLSAVNIQGEPLRPKSGLWPGDQRLKGTVFLSQGPWWQEGLGPTGSLTLGSSGTELVYPAGGYNRKDA